MDNGNDSLYINIEEKLALVSTQSSNCCIAKVPQCLRNVNEKAYEPQIIAIGPYHRGKKHLKLMEEHKLRYLKFFLLRREESNATKYVTAMRTFEESVCSSYAEFAILETDNFAEMLLLDACFIVELFRKCTMPELREHDDPVFNSFWMKKKLGRDLLLVENQLPFFILQEFFDMTVMQDEPNNFLEMIFDFFIPLLPDQCLEQDSKYSFKESKHLLSFIHDHWVSPVVQGEPNSDKKVWKKLGRAVPVSLETTGPDWEFIRCATELQEAGIKFLMVPGDSLFDINFDKGIMKIPRLKIEDDTESFFRNLIVYEQFYPEKSDPVIDYMKFMDCLINSAKDVELLCHCKILHNCLGDDEVVASMFNRLGDSVTLSSRNRYKTIFKDVNKHCSRRRNRWMANLRHNYFNTPWAFISFLAAVLLLVLTLTQTVFSVLAYFK